MWGQSKTGSASQIFLSHLYSRANEVGILEMLKLNMKNIGMRKGEKDYV